MLFRIVLPNSMAVIATIALFSAVYHWNDYYQGVIYIRSQELLPLQTMLYKIIAENSMSFMQQQAMAQFGARLPGNSIKFASMMVATLPILIGLSVYSALSGQRRDDRRDQRLSCIRSSFHSGSLISAEQAEVYGLVNIHKKYYSMKKG